MVRAISERLASMMHTHILSTCCMANDVFHFFFAVTIFLYSAKLLCGFAKDLNELPEIIVVHLPGKRNQKEAPVHGCR